MPRPAPLDLSAFDPNATVSAESIADAEQRIRDAPKKWAAWAPGARRGGLGCMIPVAVLLGASIAVYVVMAVTGRIDWDAIGEEPISAAVTLAVAFGVVALIFAAAIASIVATVRDRRSPQMLVRVLAFARDNGLEFSPESSARDFHGRIWDEGTTYRLEHLVSPQGFDYGTVGRTGRHGTIHPTSFGYLAITLDRKLPHIVLMRRRGAKLYVGDGPEFALEGDFGKHFELHVPTGYETDALYVLTPDVMRVLIDEAADRRVEIVDDRLFVFGGRVDVTDPAVHARMHRIANAVSREIVPQTDAYRDERIRRDPRRPLAIDRVASAGRRLPAVVWIPGLLIGLAILTAPAWGLIAQLIADIFS